MGPERFASSGCFSGTLLRLTLCARSLIAHQSSRFSFYSSPFAPFVVAEGRIENYECSICRRRDLEKEIIARPSIVAVGKTVRRRIDEGTSERLSRGDGRCANECFGSGAFRLNRTHGMITNVAAAGGADC